MSADLIAEALERGLADSGAPGAVAAVLRPDGEATAYAVGRRAASDPAPMTTDAIFWIASMTKALTSLLALQLVDEGRLDLDEPVGPRLPQLDAPKILMGFDADGSPQLRPAQAKVTLRRLLTHTSGVGYDFASQPLAQWVAYAGANLVGPSPPEGMPLLFEPGEGWIYGLGIDYAARLIEATTDTDLATLMSQRIFAPLGMTDTGFSLSEAQKARTVGVNMRLPDGAVVPFGAPLPEPPFFQMGGGGLRSTALDYLKFLGAVLAGLGGLLSPRSADLMTRPQVFHPRPGALKSVSPHLASDYDAFPGRPTAWSLGFLINLEDEASARPAGSLAWAGLPNCYYWADPKTKVAGVLLTQLLPFADAGVLQLFDRFERAVYAS